MCFAVELLPSRLRHYSYVYFLKNVFWSLFGALLLRSQIIIVSIFIGRILMISEFGKLGLLRSTIGTFTIFASVGVGLGATKFISEAIAFENHNIFSWVKFSYTVTFYSAGFFGIITYLIADDVGKSLLNDSHFGNYIKLSALLIFLNCILSTQIGILNGFQSFRRIAVLNMYGSILAISLQFYFTWLYHINGFILASSFSCVIQAGLNHFVIRSFLKQSASIVKNKLSKSLKKAFLNFCVPAALSGLMVTPVSWYCNTILVKGQNGFKEMAFFDIANNWRMILIFIPSTISQVVLPNITAINNRLKLRNFLYFNMLLNGCIALVSCALLLFLTIPLLKLYGDQFITGQFTFKILIISSIFLAIGNVIAQLIAGKLKMWYGFAVNIIWAIAIILLSIYFIEHQKMGAEGLAWAYLISYFIHTILQLFIFFIYFNNTKSINA